MNTVTTYICVYNIHNECTMYTVTNTSRCTMYTVTTYLWMGHLWQATNVVDVAVVGALWRGEI